MDSLSTVMEVKVLLSAIGLYTMEIVMQKFPTTVNKRDFSLFTYAFAIVFYVNTLICDRAAYWTHMSVPVLLYACVVCAHKWLAWFSLSSDDTEPPLFSGFVPWLGTAVSYGIDPQRYLQACATAVGKPIFTMYTAGDPITVILDTTFTNRFYKAGADHMNFFKPLRKVGLYELCGVNGERGERDFHFAMKLLRRSFVPLYKQKIEVFHDDLRRTLDICMPATRASVKLWPFIDALILRLSLRTICDPLAWNDRVVVRMGELEEQAEALLKRPGVLGTQVGERVRQLRSDILVEVGRVIAHRRENRNPRPVDAIDCCLEHNDKQADDDSTVCTDEFIENVCVSMMFGAVANTNASAYHTIAHLCDQPALLAAAEQEVATVLRKCGSGGQLNYEAITKMQFLEWCIYESTRLYSIVLSMRTLEQDMIVSKHFIPKDRIIAFSSNQAMLDPEVWPEPMKFNPYRYSPVHVGKDAAMRARQMHLGWGRGKHLCVGKKLALIELKMIMAMMLNRYHIHGIRIRRGVHAFGERAMLTKSSFVSLGVSTPIDRNSELLYTRRASPLAAEQD